MFLEKIDGKIDTNYSRHPSNIFVDRTRLDRNFTFEFHGYSTIDQASSNSSIKS